MEPGSMEHNPNPNLLTKHKVRAILHSLLPCPFCGHKQTQLINEMNRAGIKNADKKGFYYQRQCGSCHAEGPAAPTVDKANFLWNLREIKHKTLS